jgi:predicted porin
MKKTLIALAAFAATSAFAQSTVTLYGVADVSIAYAKNNGTDTTAASANGLLNNGSSRLGVKGVEDLGGGLKASFNFEQGINLATGATDQITFQRNSFVALSGNFGEVYAGRRLSPQFFAVAAYELTGTANYSAVATKFGFGGGSRNDAYVGYTTPEMSGFKATLGTKLADNNGGNAKKEFNVIYNKGPLVASVGYDKTDGSEQSVTAGASYNFGPATVAAGYFDPAGVKKGYSVGISAPVGPVNLTLDIATDTGSVKNSTDIVFEAKYALSKRTFAYGVLYNAGATVAGKDDVTTTGVGIRHNF